MTAAPPIPDLAAGAADGVTLDIERSTVTIAGVTFPAAIVICPPDRPEDGDGDEFARVIGWPGDLAEVYIPAENGVLFGVQAEPAVGGLTLTLDCHVCEWVALGGEGCWLPLSLQLVGKTLRAWDPRCRHPFRWFGADPDWVAETITRLSGFPIADTLDGPRVRLVPLRHFTERTPR